MISAKKAVAMRAALLLALLTASATAQVACARAGAHASAAFDLEPTPANVARVCVLRPESMAGSRSIEVRDNGRLVGATRGETFLCWIATPGAHQIAAHDDDTGPVLLHARAGGRYWLHQDIVELDGMLHAHLDWLEEPAALEMLEACETRVRVSVPGHDDPRAMPIAPAKKM